MRLKVSELTTAHRMIMGNVRVVGPRIDPAEAKALIDSGKAIILDVVASHVWPAMARTIQDSIRIPPEEIKNRFSELPRDKTIITYCT
jgi:rhodanese-related sulfurtransferase